VDKYLPPGPDGAEFHCALLAWYDRHRRELPWRARPDIPPDPYRVWLSEIMLQQTVVATVIPFFMKFIAAWPRIENLAQAELDDVLTAWAGLGYYARARNLHACARAVVADHGGRFPQDEAGLRALPGIGAYTAAAIRAIAFDTPANAVDGNIERVMARLHGVEDALPGAKPKLEKLAQALLPDRRCGDYIQALMDLGAGICTPKSPDCPRCPLEQKCAARAGGIAHLLPRRAPKALKPHRSGTAFWLETQDGYFLARTRPLNGLLGGMAEIPSTPWTSEHMPERDIAASAPLPIDWQPVAGVVTHTFTHFHLTMAIRAAGIAHGDAAQLPDDNWFWVKKTEAGAYAFPSVMKKLIGHALDNPGQKRWGGRS
jgi:A/G-specific adenine glycosylase